MASMRLNVVADALLNAVGQYYESGEYVKPFQSKELADCVVGQPGEKLENICLSNIYLIVPGGGTKEDRDIIVPEVPDGTPSARTHGDTLPASGIFFHHVKNLSMHNVNVITLEEDARDNFVFDDVEGLRII